MSIFEFSLNVFPLPPELSRISISLDFLSRLALISQTYLKKVQPYLEKVQLTTKMKQHRLCFWLLP